MEGSDFKLVVCVRTIQIKDVCLGFKVYYRHDLELVRIGLLTGTDTEVEKGAWNSLASVIHLPLNIPTHYLSPLSFRQLVGMNPEEGSRQTSRKVALVHPKVQGALQELSKFRKKWEENSALV